MAALMAVREQSITTTRGEIRIHRIILIARLTTVHRQERQACHRVAAIATATTRVRLHGKVSNVRRIPLLHLREVLIPEQEAVVTAAVGATLAEVLHAHHVLPEEIKAHLFYINRLR